MATPNADIAKEKGALKRLTLCYYGADEEIRTLDLLITNQLLYQLSYIGIKRQV